MSKVEIVKTNSLNSAKQVKNDEFYTQLTDIEKELRYYRKHFKGKTVFCNCDDPFESNFFKYFALNFNKLGLKKLIATCYAGSEVANQYLKLNETEGNKDTGRKPYKAVVSQVFDKSGDGGIDMEDIAELFKSGDNELTALEGDGDFRSEESIKLLKEADIVVTNPPFSIWREYVAQLIEYEKQFLILGNMNAITYKEIFPLLKNNEMWLGKHSGGMEFNVSLDSTAKSSYIADDGLRYQKFGNISWFTNMDLRKRHEELILVHKYSPEKYPKYDNYDAIEVSRVVNIPLDYEGVMGVPITFMDKYNPEQFEIIGCSSSVLITGIDAKYPSESFMKLVKDGRVRTKGSPGRAKPCFVDSEGFANVGYHRLFIRNRHPEKPEGEN